MKKLEAILKGRNFVDKLFGLREREIKRNLEAAKDSVESQKTKAEIDYESLCKALGEEDIDYKYVINAMIVCKGTIISAEETLKAITSIEEDLNSKIEEVE